MEIQQLRFEERSCQINGLFNNLSIMAAVVSDVERGTVGQSLDDFLDMDAGFANFRMQVLFFGCGDHRANTFGKFLKCANMREGFHRVIQHSLVRGTEVARSIISPICQTIGPAQNVGPSQQVKIVPERLRHGIKGEGGTIGLIRKAFDRNPDATFSLQPFRSGDLCRQEFQRVGLEINHDHTAIARHHQLFDNWTQKQRRFSGSTVTESMGMFSKHLARNQHRSAVGNDSPHVNAVAFDEIR